MPAGLLQVLQDASIRKVGVGLEQDAVKLKADWEAEVVSCVDLARTAKAKGLTHLTSLAKCSLHLLGLVMCKSKKIRMGNWERHPLSHAQTAYAALDAWTAAKGPLCAFIANARARMSRRTRASRALVHDRRCGASTQSASDAGERSCARVRARGMQGWRGWRQPSTPVVPRSAQRQSRLRALTGFHPSKAPVSQIFTWLAVFGPI